MTLRRNLSALALILSPGLLLGPGAKASAQDDFRDDFTLRRGGEIAPAVADSLERATPPVDSLPPAAAFRPGWRGLFQMGIHQHAAREDFWRDESRTFMSWDIGALELDENGRGRGTTLHLLGGGDYSVAGAVRFFFRWPLPARSARYVQAGGGVIFGMHDEDQHLAAPGYLVDAEWGGRWLSACTSLTVVPYDHRDPPPFWKPSDGDFPSANGTDVTWTIGFKLNGPLGGLGTVITFALHVFDKQAPLAGPGWN